MGLLKVETQNRSENLTVDFDSLTASRNGAQPENLAGFPGMIIFCDRMTGADGEEFLVHWGFTEDENDSAGDDAGNLPWDEEHIVRVTNN